MNQLLVSRALVPDADGSILSVTPESAGWEHIGSEVLALGPGDTAERSCGERELCLVVISGVVHVAFEHGEWLDLGGRADPWSGLPDAAYLPPQSHAGLRAGEEGAEVALCWARERLNQLPTHDVAGLDDQQQVRTGRRMRPPVPVRAGGPRADLGLEILITPGGWFADRAAAL